LYFFEDTNHLEEESGAFTGKADSGTVFPGIAAGGDVLAREAGRDAIDFAKLLRADCTHVRKAGGIGKSVSKDSPVEGGDFDLPRGAPAGALEAEIEAADAREERAEREDFFPFVIFYGYVCAGVTGRTGTFA
jgi:hypothetical protein